MPRKKAEIDWELVETLAKKHCTGEEIASVLGIHAETLYKRVKDKYKVGFSAFLQQKRRAGKTILRAAQWDMAVTQKDRTMLVWLGKQYLEQKDKGEQDVRNTVDIPQIRWADEGTDSKD